MTSASDRYPAVSVRLVTWICEITVLEEYVIGGVQTNLALHQRIVASPEFVNGDYDIHWLERFTEAKH